MNKQVFNPYLPPFEYVPDGEPHVFGERIYLYGSHFVMRSVKARIEDTVMAVLKGLGISGMFSTIARQIGPISADKDAQRRFSLMRKGKLPKRR